MLTPDQQDVADVLRYTGLALQLVGVGLAAIGISQVRRQWTDRPGIAGAISSYGRRAWGVLQRAFARYVVRPLRRLLRVRRDLTLHDIHVHASAGASSSADGVVIRQGPPSDGTPAERLAWLEGRVVFAIGETDRLTTELRAEREARESGDAGERQARTDALTDARDALANFAGGGLRFQAWGVACLVAGITLATIPDKLAAL